MSKLGYALTFGFLEIVILLWSAKAKADTGPTFDIQRLYEVAPVVCKVTVESVTPSSTPVIHKNRTFEASVATVITHHCYKGNLEKAAKILFPSGKDITGNRLNVYGWGWRHVEKKQNLVVFLKKEGGDYRFWYDVYDTFLPISLKNSRKTDGFKALKDDISISFVEEKSQPAMLQIAQLAERKFLSETEGLLLFDNKLTWPKGGYPLRSLISARKSVLRQFIKLDKRSKGYKKLKAIANKTRPAYSLAVQYEAQRLLELKITPQTGMDRHYHETGVLEREIPFENGEIQGLLKSFSKKGILEQTETYINNLKNGPSKSYREDGAVWYENNFSAGQEVGPKRSYRPNGKIQRETFISDFAYKTKSYFSNGKLKSVETHGKKSSDRKETTYYPNGKIKSEFEYKKNRLIYSREYPQRGKLIIKNRPPLNCKKNQTGTATFKNNSSRWIRIYINETERGYLGAGQELSLTLPALVQHSVVVRHNGDEGFKINPFIVGVCSDPGTKVEFAIPEKTTPKIPKSHSKQLSPKSTPEDIVRIMTCYACHKIPGISFTKTGSIGPLLIMKDQALKRIRSTEYQKAIQEGRAHATTSRQYVMESIVNPSAFIVPGFVDDMMKDFRHRFTISALDRLVDFLLLQGEEEARNEGLDRLPNEKEGSLFH